MWRQASPTGSSEKSPSPTSSRKRSVGPWHVQPEPVRDLPQLLPGSAAGAAMAHVAPATALGGAVGSLHAAHDRVVLGADEGTGRAGYAGCARSGLQGLPRKRLPFVDVPSCPFAPFHSSAPVRLATTACGARRSRPTGEAGTQPQWRATLRALSAITTFADTIRHAHTSPHQALPRTRGRGRRSPS